MSTSRSSDRGDAGFTLLETLIALAILAFALAALYESTGVSTRAITGSNMHLKARMLAETMLAEQTSIQDLKPGTTRGRYEQLEWEALVERGSGEWAEVSSQSAYVPYLIRITVTWPPRRSLVLETVRAGTR